MRQVPYDITEGTVFAQTKVNINPLLSLRLSINISPHLLDKWGAFHVFGQALSLYSVAFIFCGLFLGAFVVNDLHMLGGDKLNAVFLCPVHAAF